MLSKFGIGFMILSRRFQINLDISYSQLYPNVFTITSSFFVFLFQQTEMAPKVSSILSSDSVKFLQNISSNIRCFFSKELLMSLPIYKKFNIEYKKRSILTISSSSISTIRTMSKLLFFQFQKLFTNLFSIITLITQIENMSQQFEKQGGITIEQIYNTIEKNYQWESFKYIVPKKYNQTPVKQIPPSKSEPKLNYIDDVLRIKKCIPGPNAYTINTLDRPLSGKMDKNPRMTLADTIISNKKKHQSPGPGAYFTRPQTAGSTSNKNVRQYRQHYLHQVEYLSSECPGVGQYNINSPKNHLSSIKYFKPFVKEKNEGKKSEKDKQNNKEMISDVVVTGTFQWLAKQKRQACKNYFGKSKRFAVGSKFDKKPGPNSYKLNTKWTDTTNILKTSSSFSNMKSVYYN